jgi:tetratricopeptide (TPR) repeat protein
MNTGKLIVTSILVLFAVSCTKPDQTSQTAPGAPLFDDLGSHHHTVTTTSESAQKYFDQGLRLIYGFNHEEAERAFREAARLDQNLAMAWWGVAYILGPNYNVPMDSKRNAEALEAVEKAKSLQAGASEQERAYIAAIATRYSADASASRAELDRATATR